MHPHKTTNQFDMTEDRASAILARLAAIKSEQRNPCWSTRLLRALAEGSVAPAYQPIYCDAKKLVGAEAFVRWKDGEKYVAPTQLLSEIRQDSDAMEKLTIFMVDQVCRDRKDWLGAGAGFGFRSYVNVSPREFFNPSFAMKVADLLALHQMPAGSIALELSDFEEGSELINKSVFPIYLANNIPVCLDNVGKGAASFDLLEQMPFSEFKIDRTFTALSEDSFRRRKLATRWVAYAKERGVGVTLGGIESASQMDSFKGESHVRYQGWFFGKDKPAQAFKQAHLS